MRIFFVRLARAWLRLFFSRPCPAGFRPLPLLLLVVAAWAAPAVCALASEAPPVGDALVADWDPLEATKTYLFHYDAAGCSRQAGSVVRVPLRRSLANDKARAGFIKRRKLSAKEYRNYEYTIMLLDCDCANKTLSIVSSADYNKRGGQIRSYAAQYPQFRPPVDSIEEALLAAACSVMPAAEAVPASTPAGGKAFNVLP
ncbi:MAG: surface-adhesin E family protein [Pseudomonadota bacterium]